MVFDNARVSGDTLVYGNARVYGNAWIFAKKEYTKGWFIGGDDSGKITNITEQTGSTHWKAQYVLGDYEIKDIEDDSKKSELIKKADELIAKANELKKEAEKLN